MSEDARAQAIRGGVRDANRIIDGLGAHDQEYRRKELRLRNGHARRDVAEKGREEIVCVGV